MQIGDREFHMDSHHVYVMGILNVTPDSFSDGGRYRQLDQALYHVEKMVQQGADLIDIGGESTRPGYQKIEIEEEIHRVVQVVQAVKERFAVPVSVDSYKAPVMAAALEAGADMANDIWGLRYDALFCEEGNKAVWGKETMAEVIARYQKPVCMMHNRTEAVYQDLIPDMISDLDKSIETGRLAGIGLDQMILDPGIGFAKSYEDNLEVLAHLDAFLSWKLPLLLATSRKSVIGLSLDLPVEQREEGTLVTSVLAGMSGWQFVRVHDVEKNVRALKMLECILDRE